jgi:glycosyltransferase involved in cell wall biosynthesis
MMDYRGGSMKILVDGFNLALEKGTGVATYARNLTHCLQSMGYEVAVLYGIQGAPDKTPLMREVAFFDHDAGMPGKGRLRRVFGAALNPLARSAYPVELSGAVIYRQFVSRLPYHNSLWNSPHVYEIAHAHFRLYRSNLVVKSPKDAAIAHWTYPIPIRHRTAKNVYTLHDLVPLRLPYATLDKKSVYYKLVKKIAMQADHIVTVSETSKKDIVSLLNIDERKVTNTYESVSIPKEYLEQGEDLVRSEIQGSFGLDYKRYMLFYGSIEPKKNVSRIIEAHLASNIDIPLVVVGAQAWKSEREQNLLKAFAPGEARVSGAREGAKSKIMHFDYVSFQQLINLIRAARAVVFPSLYEGFGLPILEGMLCDTPVITSNFGSMSEIAGDACLLVDPYNVHDIKDAIIAAATGDELCAAKVMRGRIVAERYSPEAHQQRLRAVYGKVCGTSAARCEG